MFKKRYIAAIISLLLVFTTVFSTIVPVYAAPFFAEFGTNESSNESVKANDDAPLKTRMVNVARSKIGYYESNLNEFTEWYFGYPTDTNWCSIFVSWCGAQVGASGTAVPRRSTVDGMRSWYRIRGKYHAATSDYVPCKGDIVFMNTEVDGTDNVHHVEIITEDGFFGSNSNPSIKCIGGNTSNLNYEGMQYVTEKTRLINGSRATIVGYAHPDYENTNSVMSIFYTLMEVATPPFVRFMISKFVSVLQIMKLPSYEEPAPEVAA